MRHKLRAAMMAGALLLLGACGQGQTTEQSLRMEGLAQRLQALEDERAILDLIDTLDLAVDAKDWANARAAFDDTVQADFSSLGGAPGAISADELIASWRANLYVGKPSFRMHSGAVTRIDGDRAHVGANGYAWNALPQRAENNLWEVWGRYDFDLARTPLGWRITGMKFVALHQRGDESVRTETLRD